MAVFLTDEQDLEVDAADLVALTRYVLRDRRVPPQMEVSLLLVDPRTIADLNETHLGGRGPTDVLAFPIDDVTDAPSDAPAILGDIVLCPRVATDQAAGFGRTPHQELQLLTVHGVLHLLGMDHAEPEDEREMFGLTDELLAGYAAEPAS